MSHNTNTCDVPLQGCTRAGYQHIAGGGPRCSFICDNPDNQLVPGYKISGW